LIVFESYQNAEAMFTSGAGLDKFLADMDAAITTWKAKYGAVPPSKQYGGVHRH